MSPDLEVTRRTVLAGAGAAVGGLALAACGGDDSTTPAAQAPASQAPPSPAPPSTAPSPAASAHGEPLAQLADIPVGTAVAAKSADGKPLLVGQPQAGTAVAFSAICTHMGCTVAAAGERLECPCHGSVFDAKTGQVVNGPAERPLPSVPVHVADGAVLPGQA